MNEEEFSSDSNDEDYIPEGVSASEEDESGEDETHLLPNIDENISEDNMKNLKRKNVKNTKARKRKCSESNESEPIIKINKSENLEIINKEKDDKLWEDFLKDTSTPQLTSKTNNENIKIKVVKEYNFAGETIKVEDEIDIKVKETNDSSALIPNDSVNLNSKDNNLITKNDIQIGVISDLNYSSIIPSKLNILPSLDAQSKKKVGGLSSVLDKINKKPKINILEKSKLDWQSFTKAEGIQEDLKKHNIGKQGYLERMSFLQRTDQKQFEIERNFRLANRKPS